MLAGDPPHIGATAQAIIARRLTAPPLPLRTVRPTVPEALERAVAKALERVPSDRFASAEDFAHALRQVGGRLSAPTVVGGARHRRLVPAVVGAALIGLALVAVWVLAGRRSPTTGTVTHAQITFTGRARSPMLSPDGALLAYVEPVSGVLRVQDLSGRSSIEIARDTHVTPLHRWSPDGKSLLFTSGSLRGRHEHALYRVPRLGGDAVLVWRGLTDDYDFDADGHLLVVQRWDARVLTLDTAQFISIDSISLSDRFLEILTIACSPTAPWCSVGARKKDGTLGNWMISHNGSQAVDFLDWHGRVRWAPDGATVYFLDASGGAAVLASVPFERQGGARSPVTVLSGIAFGGAFDVSADGTKLAYETTSLASTVWLLTPARSQNRPMQRTPLLTGTARYAWASISPDGHQVALLRLAGEQRDLVVLRMGSDSVHQLTHSQTVDGPIVWSPDGNRLAYRQLTSEGPALMVLGTTGGQPERVGDRPAQEEVAWFPDGQRLMYLTLGRRNIAIVNLGTGQESDLLPDTSTTRVIGNPAVSPDGGRVAVFWVRQDGRRGLWLVDLERRSERLLVNDVLWPHQWTAPDRLYAMDGQWRLWRVRTTDGQRTLVAQLPPECAGGSMSRDAQRFVCEVTEERSDIWVATNFDPARGRQ
jgi:serine/threonine-protein kinase